MSAFDDALTQLRSSVTRSMEKDGTPGLILTITDRERDLHTETFGYADIAAKEPVIRETLFEIGSIGKSFCAIVLLQLQEEGRVDLSAPVTDYIPWFEVQSAYEPITLHHLLSHTAGITCGVDGTPEALFQIWSLREMETSALPGTFFHYSNLGYKILGHVVERITGAPYPESVQTRIFDPLGMTSSVPAITHAVRSRLAVGYVPNVDDRPWPSEHTLFPATWLEGDTADGSLVMTAGDLAIYLRMLLNRGAYPGGRLLSPESFDLFTQRVINAATDEKPWYYGYGISTWEKGGHSYIGHSGGMVGYFAGMTGDFDSGYGAVVLVNGPGSPTFIATGAVDLVRIATEGADLPDPFDESDDTTGRNFADFAGVYRGDDREWTFRVIDDQLTLAHDDGEIPLTPLGTNAFLAARPAFDRYPFLFGRVEDQVVEVAHGANWLVNDRYQGPTTFDYPEEWQAYPGRYRSHNPWVPMFTVILQKGGLWQMMPGDADGFDYLQPLTPLPDGSFRAGADEQTPERMRFDTIVDGKALRAKLSGADYYRIGPV